MTGSLEDRLDRLVVDLEAGRRHAPPRSRVVRKTRADILHTLGMPNRLPPIRHAIRRAVMEPRGITTVHSAPRSGRSEVLVDPFAISADGSAEQPGR